MSRPPLARQVFGAGRVYRHPKTGEELPSVTSIISALDKPALPRWAAREVAQYAADNWTTLAALPARERVDLLKGTPWRQSGAAAELGDRVHHACERRATGQRPNGDSEVGPFLAQFEDFLTTWQPAFRHTEFTVFNRTVGYAGTADALLGFDARNVMTDYKSGKGLWPEVALQLEALARAEVIVHPDGTEQPMPEVHALGALHLRPDRWELVQVVRSEQTWRAFLACRALHSWKAVAHRVFGTRHAGTATDTPTAARPA